MILNNVRKYCLSREFLNQKLIGLGLLEYSNRIEYIKSKRLIIIRVKNMVVLKENIL